jgi:hypothetical protein
LYRACPLAAQPLLASTNCAAFSLSSKENLPTLILSATPIREVVTAAARALPPSMRAPTGLSLTLTGAHGAGSGAGGKTPAPSQAAKWQKSANVL